MIGTSADPKKQNIEGKVFGIVLWICPIVSLLFGALSYGVALGMEYKVDKITLALVGIVFIVVGNYLPKCKQSYTVGIRTPWTLDDHEIWNKTHRLGGFVFMFMGVVMLCTCFLPEKLILILELPIIFISTLVPIVYSYVLYKKKYKENK
jgi:uncharacterized membrane protein